MPTSRVEGLLASFPKLISSNSQHTTIESSSVRYLYQPLDAHYLVLLTTLSSNILQDLSTLHLFASIVTDTCTNSTRQEIKRKVFELADAFDEVIAYGWRENVNLSKVKTCLEMDSHEEKIQEIISKNKEREVKEEGKRRAKALDQQRKEQQKKAGMSTGNSASAIGSAILGAGLSALTGNSTQRMSDVVEYERHSTPPPVAAVKGKGMQLGKKKTANVEVAYVEPASPVQATSLAPPPPPPEDDVDREDVHVEIEERITAIVNRDGGVDNLEVKGSLILHVSDADKARIRLHLTPATVDGDTQFKLHPNMDKKAWASSNVIALKDPQRPFPVNTPLAVVKWRSSGKDETALPLVINCWPSPTGNGGCDVNIEYELENAAMVFEQVVVAIPIPAGTKPRVGECDGMYTHNKSNGTLDWEIARIDADNTSGTMEFSIDTDDVDAFFPVQVVFQCPTTFTGIDVEDIVTVDDNAPITYSKEVVLLPEEYSVV